MREPDSTLPDTPSETLGIFGSWRRLYVIVAVYTIVLILLLHVLGSETSG